MVKPDSCATPSLTPVEQAIGQICDGLKQPTSTELLPLSKLVGRVLATDITSPIDVPPYNNSAMDGYAVCQKGEDSDTETSYEVVGESLAGHPYCGQLNPGECISITTGALIPDGATAVVMQEKVQKNDMEITVNSLIPAGDNIRMCGEDIQAQSILLRHGTQLTPAHIGLLASVGIDSASVYHKFRIAVLVTGDELKQAGQILNQGELYESNSPMVAAWCEQNGCDVCAIETVTDDLDAIEHILMKLSDRVDGIITTGGVSVGQADFTRTAIERLGHLDLWRIAMKPGKPLAFGWINDTWILGLPGNPVSALTTLTIIGRPIIDKACGIVAKLGTVETDQRNNHGSFVFNNGLSNDGLSNDGLSNDGLSNDGLSNDGLSSSHFSENTATKRNAYAKTTVALKKSPGRADFQRGLAWLNTDGELLVMTTGKQGSGILTSYRDANCLILLEQQRGPVEAGETVRICWL